MFCLTAAEQRALDRYAVERGIALDLLMEAAGLQVYNWIQRAQEAGLLAPDLQVLIFCGRGNNAGDGYVLARHLAGAAYTWALYEEDVERAAGFTQALAQARQAALAQGQTFGSWAEGRARIEAWMSVQTRTQSLTQSSVADSEQGARLLAWPDTVFPLPRCWEEGGRRPGPCKLLVVDAVYGSGFSCARGLSAEASSLFALWAKAREEAGLAVLSVDIPSGVSADDGSAAPGACRADWTLSFVAAKTGLLSAPGRVLAGDIYVAQIGLGPQLLRDFWQTQGGFSTACLRGEDLAQARPRRSWDSHKTRQGRALFCCGSRGLQGAAQLALLAATRMGLGYIHALVDPEDYSAALAAQPAVLWRKWTGGLDTELCNLLRKQDLVLLGPGWGPDYDGCRRALLDLALLEARQLVLDADALNLLAQDRGHYQELLRERRKRGLAKPVLTPHTGEFQRLCPELQNGSSRLEACLQAAETYSSVLLLKGFATVVADAEARPRCYLNSTGGPSLARAGTGDILSGLLAALLAQGQEPLLAAAQAAHIHGLAGDLSAQRWGLLGASTERILDGLELAQEALGWH